ncbi:GntR family transcriptional regulator [Aeromicrobium wangtongii]|uniref:GntR family transcriptional regulator n=1 Tax=Aeromicrobium wangtongii TaxID=2969247 RepID=A0ABY5M4H4_9ACTN|nr:GntR family transcriptional regulator [Aeromicrobium wangtongii]MCD9198880.1 GntR family transcriptional regulator [Aeromicrobium wangtongii]UUP13080.1 GntR family transcriptional regulator [Aeromicrobium wangtongii]
MRLGLDTGSGEAPFEQVRRQVAELAADGTLPAGHKLPTVRALAADLGLAVNTVAKAYRALEADGVIETRGRNGTFIAVRHAADDATDDAARAFVLQARRQGLSRDEAIRLLETHWA